MAVDSPARSSGPSRIAGYAAIHPNLLRTLVSAPVDLFVLPEGYELPKLLSKAGLDVTSEQIEKIRRDSSKRLYVREGDYRNLTGQLLESIDELIQDESIPQPERFAFLQSAAEGEIQHACTLLSPDKYVRISQQLGGNLVALLQSGEVMPSELFHVAQHDYRTFAHVTNVSCYAVLLATGLGVSDEEELRQIAFGGLVHDLGKRRVPGEILRKPGALTVEERALIERHPQQGYEELVGRGDLSHGQLMMVYQHHERLDGSGYPVQILGDEIHPWARITAVVDVFDAMTSNRSYRIPAQPAEVVDYLQSNAGSHFDREMVQCWKHLMAQA